MARKVRSDQTVGSHGKKHRLPAGTLRNADGRYTRSDKKTGTICKEGEKEGRGKIIVETAYGQPSGAHKRVVQMSDRSAVDTIRGYFYQFDYSILSLLQLAEPDGSIAVECIEDVDIRTVTEDRAVQCKYYAGTEYNHSVIKLAVMAMLSLSKRSLLGRTRPSSTPSAAITAPASTS